MKQEAFFKVHPKLAQILGETYRSVELALKELIDNSYDADAENVFITIPEILDSNPTIIIEDDGLGMSEEEVRNDYLNIANSRTSRKGNKSILKKRKVKGRKGIGKFAGLMIAESMSIETVHNNKLTTFEINRKALEKSDFDIEKVPIPIQVFNKDNVKNGLRLSLSGLSENLTYPIPEKLKEILLRDYGRENDFKIKVNNEPVCIENLPGTTIQKVISLENGNKAYLTFTIANKPIKNSGIVLRVNNKIIGSPENFLKSNELVPRKLQNRVYGELVCDFLEEDLTSDFGAVVENSKAYKDVSINIEKVISGSLTELYKTDMKMAHARYQRKINAELEKLPQYKKAYAEKALYKVLDKFFGEPEEKMNTIISVMVSALEKDYYWEVVNTINESRDSDIENFAEALSNFGLVEIGMISTQAVNRLRFLDELLILVNDKNTVEKTIHKALEKNTWVIGDDYSVIFSDTSFQTAIKNITGKPYKGEDPLSRPDLFLGRKLDKELVLIEFKRPSFTLTRDTESQAQAYRDDLYQYYKEQRIEIILLGGKIKGNINSNIKEDVNFISYIDLIGKARSRIEWLIDELKKN